MVHYYGDPKVAKVAHNLLSLPVCGSSEHFQLQEMTHGYRIA